MGEAARHVRQQREKPADFADSAAQGMAGFHGWLGGVTVRSSQTPQELKTSVRDPSDS